MAIGTYNINEVVIITLQLVNPDYSPITGVIPTITEVIGPDGLNHILNPFDMTESLNSAGTYTGNFLPTIPGNYTAVISVIINGSPMISMEKFIVTSSLLLSSAPRAEAV